MVGVTAVIVLIQDTEAEDILSELLHCGYEAHLVRSPNEALNCLSAIKDAAELREHNRELVAACQEQCRVMRKRVAEMRACE